MRVRRLAVFKAMSDRFDAAFTNTHGIRVLHATGRTKPARWRNTLFSPPPAPARGHGAGPLSARMGP